MSSSAKNFREYMKSVSSQEKSSTPESKSGFRQYIEKTQISPDEDSWYSKYVERPVQITGQSASAGLRALPKTTYDVAKFLGSAVPGPSNYIVQALEKLEENSPEKFRELMSSIFPSYENVRERQFSEGAPKPEGAIEGFLEKAGRFAGESAIPLVRGGQKLRQLAGIAGAAGGAQAGEEMGLNPLAQAALTMGGALLGHAGSGIRSPSQRLTPEAERYVQASRDLGIDLLATGMSPGQIQKAAQKWATHGVGGHQVFEDAYRARSGQVAREFHSAMEQVGQELFTEPHAAGVGLQEGIRDATRQVEHTKGMLYRAIDQTLPPNASITPHNPQTFLNNANQAIQSLEQSISQTPREAAIYNRLINARDEIMGMLTNPNTTNELPIRNLEGSVRSLNDIIRWEHPGGVDKLLIPFARDLRNELNRYGRINPQYGTARNAANDYFANQVVQIRQNVLQSIARGERPEAALNLMNTVSGIRNVEQALSHLPHGQELFDGLRRFKLRSLIMDKVIDPSTGLMRLPTSGTGLQNFLSKKTDFYPVLRELAGPQAIQHLGRLEHVGEGLARGFNALANPSKSADTALAIYNILSPSSKIAKGIGTVLSGDLKGIFTAAQGAAQLLMPRIMAEMVLNPQFADRIYEASQAARNGNAGRFNRIISAIDQKIKQESPEESPPKR